MTAATRASRSACRITLADAQPLAVSRHAETVRQICWTRSLRRLSRRRLRSSVNRQSITEPSCCPVLGFLPRAEVDAEAESDGGTSDDSLPRGIIPSPPGPGLLMRSASTATKDHRANDARLDCLRQA